MLLLNTLACIFKKNILNNHDFIVTPKKPNNNYLISFNMQTYVSFLQMTLSVVFFQNRSQKNLCIIFDYHV